MGKSDVQFTVGSDVEKAVQDMAKLVSKHEELLAKIRNTNEEGKRSSSVWSEISKNAASVVAGIASYEGVMKAASYGVQSLKRDFEELIVKQKEAAKAVLDLAQNTIRAAGIGNISGIDQINSEIVRKSALYGITTGQMAEAYTNYRTAALSNESDTMTAASRISRFKDVIDTSQVSSIAGRLKYSIPGLTAEQSVNMAIQMNKLSRGDPGRVEGTMLGVQQLQEGGLDANTALAVSMGFLEKGLPAKSLTTFSGMVIGPMDTVQAGFGKSLTDRQRIQNEYAALTAKERVDWLFSNQDKAKTLFGDQYVKLAPALKGGLLEAGHAEVQSSMSNAATDAILAKSQTETQVKISEVHDRAEAAKEQIMLSAASRGTTGLTREGVEGFIDAMPGQWGPGLNWASRFYTKTRLNVMDYMGWNPYMQGAEDYLSSQYKGGTEASQKATLELINAIHELNKTVKEQNRQQQQGPRVGVLPGGE